MQGNWNGECHGTLTLFTRMKMLPMRITVPGLTYKGPGLWIEQNIGRTDLAADVCLTWDSKVRYIYNLEGYNDDSWIIWSFGTSSNKGRRRRRYFGDSILTINMTVIFILPSYVMTLSLTDRAHHDCLFNLTKLLLDMRAPVFGICLFALSFFHTLHITRTS